jgi:hypothetical protein
MLQSITKNNERFQLLQDYQVPDQKDIEIAKEIIKNYNNELKTGDNDKEPGIRIGDYLKINDTYYRISHIWDDSIQFSEGGSFSISTNGYVSYSGALFTGIQKTDIKLNENEEKEGMFWFPHHNYLCANCSINLIFNVKVYEYTGLSENVHLY